MGPRGRTDTHQHGRHPTATGGARAPARRRTNGAGRPNNTVQPNITRLPRCGGISPNRWHFDTNHGAIGNSDLCISQHLAKAHVQSAHRDGNPEHIAATTARARELRVPTT